MVQLKGNDKVNYAQVHNEFQFQYGTIKSSIFSMALASFVNFNSNMVQLKVKILVQYLLAELNFNSNMVQLKANWAFYLPIR